MPESTSLVGESREPRSDSTCCRAWVRQAPRQQTPSYLLTLSQNESWPARVQNLSTGGVGLLLQERIDLNRFVLVELVSASRLFSRLLLTRVVHLSKCPDGGFLLGGEFINELPADELRFLLS